METETTPFPLPSSFPPVKMALFRLNKLPTQISFRWPHMVAHSARVMASSLKTRHFPRTKKWSENRKILFYPIWATKKNRFWEYPHQHKTDLFLLRFWESTKKSAIILPCETKRWPILGNSQTPLILARHYVVSLFRPHFIMSAHFGPSKITVSAIKLLVRRRSDPVDAPRCSLFALWLFLFVWVLFSLSKKLHHRNGCRPKYPLHFDGVSLGSHSGKNILLFLC